MQPLQELRTTVDPLRGQWTREEPRRELRNIAMDRLRGQWTRGLPRREPRTPVEDPQEQLTTVQPQRTRVDPRVRHRSEGRRIRVDLRARHRSQEQPMAGRPSCRVPPRWRGAAGKGSTRTTFEILVSSAVSTESFAILFCLSLNVVLCSLACDVRSRLKRVSLSPPIGPSEPPSFLG